MNKSFFTKEAKFDIGHYAGEDTAYVKLEFDGRGFIFYDYGGIEPRHVRLGKFIEKAEEISGLKEYNRMVKVECERLMKESPINQPVTQK